jgi:ABC-type branched-subunit amino acid transport system permease subunit
VTFILVLREMLRGQLRELLRGASGEHEIIFYGLLLVLIMIFMPQGIVVELMERLRRAGWASQGPRRTLKGEAR